MNSYLEGNAGVFAGVPMKTYLRDKAISRSFICRGDGCPAKWKRPDEPATPAKMFGSSFHGYALESKMDWVVKPDDCDYRTKAGREWRDSQTKRIITPDEEREITRAGMALRKHTLAWPLIDGGQSEMSIFASYGGFWMKSRPDVINGKTLVDLKTTSNAATHAIRRDIATYNYHVQMALAWKLLDILKRPIEACYLIFIERGDGDTDPLFNVVRLSNHAIEVGLAKLNRLLEEYARCVKSNSFPDYSGTEIKKIDVPTWAEADDALELKVGGMRRTL